MSLGKSSAIIAAGTLASRITGLLRTITLVAAIGIVGHASDAFATANQLPNSIYAVISAGVLTGVVVPQVVRASAREDGGHAFLSKLLTIGIVALTAITTVAVFSAPFLVDLFAPGYTPEQHQLATLFAYWCLPQVFFYGIFALLGEVLNARRVFAPYAWAPIVNNVVSIGGLLVFIGLFGTDQTEIDAWNPVMIVLLAGTATLGIVAQTVVLVVAWQRAKIPLRLDFHWRGMGLRTMRNLATWTFLTTLVAQLVGIIQQRTVSAASGSDAAVAVWQNAWLVYMMPYSLIVLAIGTPYFTRLSEHAAAGRDEDVRSDIGQSMRVIGLFVIVAFAAVGAAALPASRIFSNSTADAIAVAPVLLAFLCSLLPMALLFIVQRTFYAYGDARTPFVFTLISASLIAIATVVVGALVPVEWLTASVALVQTLGGIVQVTIAIILLRRKLGHLGLGSSWWALARFVLMAIPAGAAGVGVFLAVGGTEGWMLNDKLWGAVGVCVIGGVCAAVYVAMLALFRAPELAVALGALKRLRP